MEITTKCGKCGNRNNQLYLINAYKTKNYRSLIIIVLLAYSCRPSPLLGSLIFKLKKNYYFKVH